MNSIQFTFCVALLTACSQCAPQRPTVGYEVVDNGRWEGRANVDKDKKAPAQIAFFEQGQSDKESSFRYTDTDGTSRHEHVVFQTIKDGDKEVVVPEAKGGYEYVADGVKVSQTYTAGVKGNNYVTILDFKPQKKGNQ